jgi:hypothetical protein
MADDGDNGVHIKGHMVWTLETGARLLTSSQVTFDETRYPKLMGVTEWVFSMRAQIAKCKATVAVMNFDTESVDRHPFAFEEDELKHREKKESTRFDPQHLVGILHKGKKREGKIHNFLKQYKVWGVVLCKAGDEDPPLVYVTTSQMADQNKVKFHEKILKYKAPRYVADVKSDVNINVIHFQDETHELN